MTIQWIDPVYNAVAILGAGLCVYVMQKTEHDRINKIDPHWLQWFRRFAFIVSALALCYSVMDDEWQRSLPVLGLVSAGVINLSINAMALYMRSPAKGGGLRARNAPPIKSR